MYYTSINLGLILAAVLTKSPWLMGLSLVNSAFVAWMTVAAWAHTGEYIPIQYVCRFFSCTLGEKLTAIIADFILHWLPLLWLSYIAKTSSKTIILKAEHLPIVAIMACTYIGSIGTKGVAWTYCMPTEEIYGMWDRVKRHC